jgi:hypothetical protein
MSTTGEITVSLKSTPDGSIPASNMGMDDGVGGEMIDSMYAIGLRK